LDHGLFTDDFPAKNFSGVLWNADVLNLGNGMIKFDFTVIHGPLGFHDRPDR